jgi:phosphoserine aminotransferase
MLDFRGSGQSVMELSHRSKEFEGIMKETEKSLRELLKVPTNWKILFMTGGATGQFACVPLNLMNGKKKACYAVNGAWGEKAM